MDSTLKECAEMLIMLLATELELKLEDVIKENLPNWKETTPKERQQICQSIGKYWLKQEFKGE
jgi:hypothetical protein